MKVVRVLFVAVSTLVAGAALQAQPPATPPTILHRFSAQLRAGLAPLTEAPDGRLFGVLEQGGPRDQGAVYVLTPDGNGGYAFSPLWWFNGFNGRKPTGLTYSAVDDKLYGTTSEGGVNGSIYDGMGTVFSLNSDGTGFAKLIDFDLAFSVPQPGHPQAGLLEASDGYFYGTGSTASTTPGSGAIFRMDRTGAYNVIWIFNGTNGGTPQSKLVEGSDGFLYGTTTFGGANNAGTVFKIDKAGAALTILHQFTGTAATQPRGLLLDTSTGSDVFYGLTGGGGTDDLGSVFSITPSGTFTTIASFTMTPGFFWATQGAYPIGALVRGSNGLLYGTTESAGPFPFSSVGVVFSVDPASGEIVVVHDYSSDPGTGLRTNAGLTVAADGTLVGTALNGGAHSVGTAYRVDASAASPVVAKIADFPSQGPSIPPHRLLRASDGFLYGTTQSGGDFNSGTIFRYANGVATAIHDFNFVDGHQPSGELVEGSDGFLYGTTPYGGNVLFPGDVGGGTIYRIAKDGSGFAVVHRFSDYATEGAYPLAGLVEGPDGNFYGTTHQNGPGGAGTVFKVTPSGTLTTLHAFNVWSSTTGTLVIGEDGYFYGVTREGGSTPTGGTIYKIDSEGNFVLLHEFVNIADGAHPNALALGTDGNLYGTTEHGGTFFGTLFRITPTGVFTVLHRFNRDVDGSDPMSAPFEAGDGNFYGTAWFGGRVTPFISGIGTLYRYDASSGVQLLHTFDGREFGDISPIAGLTQGSDNRLYGALTDPAGGALYAINPGVTNKAPTVRHQRHSIAPGQLQTITLTASDPDGDPLTFTIVGQPAHGTVSGTGPTYLYQPNPGFSGTDYFYVRTNDGTVSSAVAGVLINVGSANTPPVAYDAIFTTAEDFSVATLMTTFDAELNPLSYTVVTPPAHGTLSGSAPDFIYNPVPNYNGPDSFTFKVNDGTADSNVATISITVDPVNDAPVASDQGLTSNASAAVPLVLSAVDVDGDALSYHIVDNPQHGVLTGSAPNLTYTPEAGFSGTDTFTFYAHDGTVASNVGTVTIAVTAPVAIGTTTTLQTSANVVGMLQPLTLTATVSPVSGGGVPTGNVMFMLNGSLMVGLVPLVNGVATLHGNGGAAPAVSSITAHYAGAGSFTSSSSAPVSITTLPGSASSFTFLLPWTNPQSLGSPVTVSAYVLALGTAPAPTGTVEFYDGAALVGTAALSNGLATVTFLASIGGTHTLSAKYLGSTTFAGSTAAPAQITVFSGAMPAATTTALTVTPNPAQPFAQPVTFTATVSGGVTGGTATFFMDGVVVGTAPVLNVGGTMQATLSLQDMALGTRVVSASYGGAPGFAASNSVPLILTARP